jgi:hypothetical protein
VVALAKDHVPVVINANVSAKIKVECGGERSAGETQMDILSAGFI